MTTSTSISSTQSSTQSVPSLSLTGQRDRDRFTSLANERFSFEVNGIDYCFRRTAGGYVIQPQSDFDNSKRSGFYVSRDFKVMKSDDEKNTQAAIAQVKLKMAEDRGEPLSRFRETTE